MQVQMNIPRAVRIKRIIQETPFVKTFIFDYALDGTPGQFVNLWLPRVDEKPMSIAYNDGKEFWVTIFRVGNFSMKMHTLQEGDLIGVRGPYGKGFAYVPGQRLVMMGGGYGAAPLYFLTTQAVKDGCRVDFVLGARSSEHLLYEARLRALPNVTVHVTTDDGSAGEKGFNIIVLERLLAAHQNGERIDGVYTCGPELMEKRISDMCFEANVPLQVSLERYMKCGFGVCGQCTVDDSGERICMVGPVVSNEKARSLKEFGVYHRDSVGKVKELVVRR